MIPSSSRLEIAIFTFKKGFSKIIFTLIYKSPVNVVIIRKLYISTSCLSSTLNSIVQLSVKVHRIFEKCFCKYRINIWWVCSPVESIIIWLVTIYISQIEETIRSESIIIEDSVVSGKTSASRNHTHLEISASNQNHGDQVIGFLSGLSCHDINFCFFISKR